MLWSQHALETFETRSEAGDRKRSLLVARGPEGRGLR